MRNARALAAAVSFLTILPIARRVELDGRDVARGSVLFPLVGGAIGAIGGGLVWALGDDLPALLAAAIGVTASVVVTGALHLDGLADSADGFGGRTPEDRLRIMRDHTIGTYGASALLLDLLLRVGALSALAGTGDALLFSVAAGALSRTAGPALAAWLPYARSQPGAGEALSAFPSTTRAVASAALGTAAAVACAGVDVWAAVLVTVLVVATVGWASRRRLGGVTGDVMGAASELVEISVLVALLAVR